MSRNLSINVNVNPNGQASPTETRISEATETTKAAERSVTSGITGAAIFSVARRGIALATANIGEVTGSRSLQRRLQFGTQLGNLAIIAKSNPKSAAILFAVQTVGQAAGNFIENRNLESNIRYNQTLRSATFNNSRR